MIVEERELLVQVSTSADGNLTHTTDAFYAHRACSIMAMLQPLCHWRCALYETRSVSSSSLTRTWRDTVNHAMEDGAMEWAAPGRETRRIMWYLSPVGDIRASYVKRKKSLSFPTTTGPAHTHFMALHIRAIPCTRGLFTLEYKISQNIWTKVIITVNMTKLVSYIHIL